MFKFVLFALFFSCVFSAKLQVANGANVFEISVSYTGTVTWTKNGVVYNHLQQLSPTCTDGATPISLGNGNWTCGPYDTLMNIQANCSAFQVVKYINGSFVCAQDNDVLASLTYNNCTVGEVVKTDSNGVWACQVDENLLTNSYGNNTLGCPNGGILIYNVTNWQCVDASHVPDSNILGKLQCGAQAGGRNVVKYNSTSNAFQCDFDIDLVPVCYNGATLAYNGTAWLCAPDSDTTVNVTCSSSAPYYRYVGGAWQCVSSFFNFASKRNVEVFGGEIIVLNALVANLGTSGSGTSFTATWGNENLVSDSTVPPVLPINGTIYSVRLYLDKFTVTGTATKNLTLTVLVNGSPVSTAGTPTGGVFSVAPGPLNQRSFLYTLAGGAGAFPVGSSISATLTTWPALTYKSGTIGFNFYIQV